tara:strand:+ start:200 stop:1357 length:1158 start_codon:yes stop_codon:yes gene_type:complete
MANLLEKASIILTPTAYSDGKMHSAKPIVSTNPSVGDFDFARASVATRVNENGLIEEVASGLPRIDYTDGSGSWLLEPTATNLIRYSEDFSKAAWAKSNSTITANSEISPDGTLNASLWSHPGGSFPQLSFSGITFVSGADYSPSLYVKSDGTTQVQHSLLVNNVVINFTPTDKWVRISDLIVPPDTSGSFVLAQNSGSSVPASFYIWGAQLEQNSYPTSYIKTIGTAQTRVVDTATGSGSSTVINSTEGVLYAEASKLINGVASESISLYDGTNNNLIQIQWNATIDRFQFFARGGAGAYDMLTVNNIVQTDMNKVALSWDSVNFYAWINGVKVGTLSISNLPIDLNTLNFGDGVGGNFYGKTKSVQVYTTALSDAELTTLTTI